MSNQYFAGLFDGEGCIGLYSNKVKGDEYLSLEVSISMKHIRAIKFVADNYPEASFRKYKDMWRVKFTGTKTRNFLEDILPYTIVKTKQVILALDYLDLIQAYPPKSPKGLPYRAAYGKRPQSYWKEARTIAAMIKETKQLTGEE